MFSETEPVHIMFIDLGYTGYSVSIVDFMQVTTHPFDLLLIYTHTLDLLFINTPS